MSHFELNLPTTTGGRGLMNSGNWGAKRKKKKFLSGCGGKRVEKIRTRNDNFWQNHWWWHLGKIRLDWKN